jgi:predicted membrane channel-forming protein YqfA (hemolysin III family)
MVPQQPVNTYTNVLYLTGGLFLVFYLNTLTSYVFFITSFYLCTGSALYHSTSTRWGGSLDVSAMYAVFSSLTVYAASTLIGLEDSLVALIMFVVAVLIGWLLRYKYKGNMVLKIGIFILLIYSFLIWSMVQHNMSLFNVYLISSFVLYVIAFIIWILDKKRIFPIKRWGHGLWHIFTAVAISMLFYAIYLI